MTVNIVTVFIAVLTLNHPPLLMVSVFITAFRLIGGTRSDEGYLQYYYLGLWKNVSAAVWNAAMATVACRNLGFSNQVNFHKSNERLHESATCIWFDDLKCLGTENSLLNCRYGRKTISLCNEDSLWLRCKPQG